jgi:hypothetical protein
MSLRSASRAASWASLWGSAGRPGANPSTVPLAEFGTLRQAADAIVCISSAEAATSLVMTQHFSPMAAPSRSRNTGQLVSASPKRVQQRRTRFSGRLDGFRVGEHAREFGALRSNPAEESSPCSAAASRNTLKYSPSSARLSTGGFPFAALAGSAMRTSTCPRVTRLLTNPRWRSQTDRLPRCVDVHVQPAMIHALQTHDQLAFAQRTAGAGKASHAAEGGWHILGFEKL